MATYVQTDADGRIVAYMEADSNPDSGVWKRFDLPEQRLSDFNDYLLVDGKLVYDPLPPDPEAEAEKARAQAVANLPQYVSDTDAAICELYELIIGE